MHENVSCVYLVVLIVLMACDYAMFPASDGDVRTCKRSWFFSLLELLVLLYYRAFMFVVIFFPFISCK